MSIEAAKKELVKEIDTELARLTSETEELTKLRASVLSGTFTAGRRIKVLAGRKAAKKTATKKAQPKKAVSTKAKAEEPKKRKLSAAGRKAISEAAKRRWADKKKSEAAK